MRFDNHRLVKQPRSQDGAPLPMQLGGPQAARTTEHLRNGWYPPRCTVCVKHTLGFQDLV